MKAFLKPSIGKIILTIVVFLVSFFILQIVLSFYSSGSSMLCLPEFTDAEVIPTPVPVNLRDVIMNIPVVDKQRQGLCQPAIPSVVVAESVRIGLFQVLWFISSYLVACFIVTFFTKNKKTRKPSLNK